jgi:hypothetical protein
VVACLRCSRWDEANVPAPVISSTPCRAASVSSLLPAEVGRVPTPSLTPLTSVGMDALPLAGQPVLVTSSPTPSPIVPAVQADFTTPSRQSVRFGTTADGESVTDEDSL